MTAPVKPPTANLLDLPKQSNTAQVGPYTLRLSTRLSTKFVDISQDGRHRTLASGHAADVIARLVDGYGKAEQGYAELVRKTSATIQEAAYSAGLKAFRNAHLATEVSRAVYAMGQL